MDEKLPGSASHEAPTVEQSPAGGAAGAPHWSSGYERRIGPYRLVRELGHGGMGTVYLAARSDDAYRKLVAIKIIRGAEGVDRTRRFRRERQILAGLEHPNIATLLDGGTTDEGLSYFVMEFVEGEPLDAYCDRHRLSIKERIGLFRVVCSAVQYAHRNLVVHRDLKPGNILVTSEGTPKLLDFGLATLLQPEPGERGAEATWMALTPRYASPEQVRGGAVTTATDVYSLGVVLYELLTGLSPYRLTTQETPELLRAICDDDPERPSTVVVRREAVAESEGTGPGQSKRRLRRRLRGELDNIVLMALRKEPQRRYGSVEALSEDLGRYLDGLPVLARQPTPAYRISKFVRRHAVGVTAATLLFLLTLSFAVAMAAQSRRMERERDKARRLAAFMVDLFKVSDPDAARGNTITAREVLDHGAAKIERELVGEPQVKAALMTTMGGVYTGLGLYDQAQAMLESSLAARHELLGPHHPDVAESQHFLATVLWREGRYPESERLFREALATRRERRADDPLAEILSLLGLSNVLEATGDLSGAESTSREAVALLRGLPEPPLEVLSGALGGLAATRSAQNDLAEAESLTREAIALQRKVGGDDDPRVAAWVFNLGTFLQARGDWEGSEAAFEEGLAVYRKALGADHPEYARNLNNFAAMLNERGSSQRAEELATDAVAIYRRTVGAGHPDLAPALDTLAAIHNARGDFAVAEALAREAVAITRKAVGDRHLYFAYEATTLAQALQGQGKAAEAESIYRQVIAINDRVLPPDAVDRSYALIGLGTLAVERGEAAAAEPMLDQALSLRRAALPAGHWRIAESEAAIGACLARLGRSAEAKALLTQAETVLSAGGAHPVEAGRCREALAALAGS
jgi:serine/threonine-protein kinase